MSMQPDPGEIQQLFDRIAPLYDRLNDSLSFGTHRIWKQMAVNWSGARGGGDSRLRCLLREWGYCPPFGGSGRSNGDGCGG